MDRSELEKLAERYQQKADRAFENYQDTGLRRYDTERNNMEDLADALRMAANAADEHAEYTNMRGSILSGSVMPVASTYKATRTLYSSAMPSLENTSCGTAMVSPWSSFKR